MRILKHATAAELMIKNSRFLAEAIPVETPETARKIWHEQKNKYDNGNHVVYAFITGPQRNIMSCSDDGEPSGTAGRPMLEVVKGSGLTNLIVTAARWFGGTLLGTGGLVRAYTMCAQAALEQAEVMELVPMRNLTFPVPYALYEQVKRILGESGFEIQNENFAEAVTISGTLPESCAPEMLLRLRDLSGGKIRCET